MSSFDETLALYCKVNADPGETPVRSAWAGGALEMYGLMLKVQRRHAIAAVLISTVSIVLAYFLGGYAAQ